MIVADRSGVEPIGCRYGELGLLGNPFAGERDRADGGDSFVSRGLPAPPPPGSKTLVQIIGAKGYGKTTHLQRWRNQTGGPYHYVPRNPYRSRWRRPPVASMVYADEVDRMPAGLRRLWFGQLARTHATVVVGTHEDLGRIAVRAGLQVLTHYLPPADAATLASILEARVRTARIDPGYISPFFSRQEIDLVETESGGAIRLAEDVAHRIVALRCQQTRQQYA